MPFFYKYICCALEKKELSFAPTTITRPASGTVEPFQRNKIGLDP